MTNNIRLSKSKESRDLYREAKSWTREVSERLLPYVDKPAQYLGGEYNTVEKDWRQAAVKMALLFPDLYEIGMSHLGMRILYEVVNRREEFLLERCFAPAADMERLMRAEGIPLFSWENYHAIRDFDVVGVTLQYEMSFSNILNMLELAGIPLLAAERGEGWDWPLVVAGGPCAYNPEPLADFFDLFIIGEGEAVEPELLALYQEARQEGLDREAFLRRAARIPGIYVPAFYRPVWQGEQLAGWEATPGAPERVLKRLVTELEGAEFPERQIVPFAPIVHDRAVVEVMRGCNRGCRFCQAGIIYRPVREKSPELLRRQAAAALKSTGYDELGLISLSTADYSCVEPLLGDLLAEHGPAGVNVSLPSLRVDAVSVELAAKLQAVRKSGLTLAPEAGTQRLRDIINKGVAEADIFAAVEAALAAGWSSFKLYFMAGLPYETDDDLRGIANLARQILSMGRGAGLRRPLNITVSVAFFVPKSHTPFQWFGQNSREELARKRELLFGEFKNIRGARLNCHDIELSFLEGVFSRGDRRLGRVLLAAHKLGCKFDSWHEHFDPEKWAAAFEEAGIRPEDYAERQFTLEDALPWDPIDCGVSKNWLWREWQKAAQAEKTPDCRKGPCSGCGICPALGCDNHYIKNSDIQNGEEGESC